MSSRQVLFSPTSGASKKLLLVRAVREGKNAKRKREPDGRESERASERESEREREREIERERESERERERGCSQKKVEAGISRSRQTNSSASIRAQQGFGVFLLPQASLASFTCALNPL